MKVVQYLKEKEDFPEGFRTLAFGKAVIRETRRALRLREQDVVEVVFV